MYKYLNMQEAPVVDSVTEDGHIGSRQPWPVIADADGTVYTPSSMLGLRRVFGFQKDVHVQKIDLYWEEAFADPSKAVGMYMVTIDKHDVMAGSMSAVSSAEYLETPEPLPID
jgi:hypothetical protein